MARRDDQGGSYKPDKDEEGNDKLPLRGPRDREVYREDDKFPRSTDEYESEANKERLRDEAERNRN